MTSVRSPAHRSAGATALDCAVRKPKTCPVSVTVGDLQPLFDDEHVHMALLTSDGYLFGCVVRYDLVAASPSAPALSVSRLRGRSIAATQPIEAAWDMFRATGRRRLAVVDHTGHLAGLLCLKRSGAGFCSDGDVASRAAEKRQTFPGRDCPGAGFGPLEQG